MQGIADFVEVLLLVVQILTLIALIVYVWKTWEMATATKDSTKTAQETLEEMRRAREHETAPYVVVFFAVPDDRKLIYLVVKNVGRSIATDINLDFDPPIQGKLSEFLNRFVNLPIPSLPPGYELHPVFHEFSSYLDIKNNYPLHYNVKVRYRGGIENVRREDQYIIDLSQYKYMPVFRSSGKIP